MRVIAGAARGRRLSAVPGEGTRPITDRAKEALFSILAPEVPGAWLLDLYAGTGAVGIEAISRGAEGCDFVERAPAAVQIIQTNLEQTGLARESARVWRRDVFQWLARTPEAYHIVYVAPPQYKGLWLKTLEALDAQPAWLAEDGVIVVQIHPREEEPVALQHFVETDRRNYGSVRLLFYRLRSEEQGEVEPPEAAP
jgi:16S rRNA (guanine(966)-N(2))-methyltransferase RsmD